MASRIILLFEYVDGMGGWMDVDGVRLPCPSIRVRVRLRVGVRNEEGGREGGKEEL